MNDARSRLVSSRLVSTSPRQAYPGFEPPFKVGGRGRERDRRLPQLSDSEGIKGKKKIKRTVSSCLSPNDLPISFVVQSSPFPSLDCRPGTTSGIVVGLVGEVVKRRRDRAKRRVGHVVFVCCSVVVCVVEWRKVKWVRLSCL